MNKLQERQYELLVEFDRICKKNNLEYFLDGGTLLGAVRHQGFIPWDDDLDVSMFRDDYEKFKEIVKKDLDDRYFFQNYETDNNFGFMFGKLRIKNTKYTERVCKNTKAQDGIFIDIFPFDTTSADEKESEKDFKKVVILRMMLLLKNKYIIETDTFIKKIEKVILKIMSLFVSKQYIIEKINKIASKYKDVETGYFTNYSTPYFNKSRLQKKWYNSTKFLKFETKDYPCPSNYNDDLEYIFGDYMTLPPVEKRRSHGIIDVEFEDGTKYNN